MRVCDLKDDEIFVGMRLRSLSNPALLGTIVDIKYPPDDRYQYAWIKWDGEDEVHSGFFENQCKCEVMP